MLEDTTATRNHQTYIIVVAVIPTLYVMFRVLDLALIYRASSHAARSPESVVD